MSSNQTITAAKRFYFSPELVKARRTKTENKTKEKKTKEEFTRKEIVGAGSGYTGPVHKCPLTATSFKGGCPIIPCHANITSYRPEKSCCIYIESGKLEFDKWDLQEHLGIKESKLYKCKERGEKKIVSVVLLNRILNYLRENFQVQKVETKDIPKIANFINASYLGLQEINSHLTDVELIKSNIDKVYELISKSGQSITLPELFGTDQPLP